MKKPLLVSILALTAVAAVVTLLIHRQASPAIALQDTRRLRQADADDGATQSVSVSTSQQEAPSHSSDSGLSAAEWEDHVRWWKGPEWQAVSGEIVDLEKRAEARGSLTTNEVATLIAYMHNPRYDVRNWALLAAAIGRGEPAKSMLLPHVVSLLQDRAIVVRMSAARAMGVIGDKADIPYLEPLMNDKSEYVVESTQEAISKLQQKDR
jgi:HEAT repeat protein